MGNPPFVGYKLQTKQQKEELNNIFEKVKISDYVSGWYAKASEIMSRNTDITTAFVSTNSITQGEQVAAIWGTLTKEYQIHINFAYRTFIWDSEATEKAHVHCVIIGFSVGSNSNEKMLVEGDSVNYVSNINFYLVPADNIFITKTSKPLCGQPAMIYGSEPREGGNLILSSEEREALIHESPFTEKIIKRFVS